MSKVNLFALVILGSLLVGCEGYNEGGIVVPSEVITSINHDVDYYNGIEISSTFTAYVGFSDTNHIEIEANQNLHDYITVKRYGDILVIELKDNIRIKDRKATLNVYITTDYLGSIEASGSSRIFLQDAMIARNTFFDLSGASFLQGAVETGRLVGDISGASTMNVTGSANEVNVELSGASILSDYGLQVNILDVELSGASNCYLTVNEQLSVNASGASNVFYRGEGVVDDVELSGASNISKAD
jgi:hypothetical protein